MADQPYTGRVLPAPRPWAEVLIPQSSPCWVCQSPCSLPKCHQRALPKSQIWPSHHLFGNPFLAPHPTVPTHLQGVTSKHAPSCHFTCHSVLPGMPSHLLSFSQLLRYQPASQAPSPRGSPLLILCPTGPLHASVLAFIVPEDHRLPRTVGSGQAL